MRPSFFHHLHPPTIPAGQARFRYTLGAGGLAVFLVLVVGVTGILETFYYIPTPDQAGLSVQTISYLVPFGGLVRNLHYWAAQLLVAVSGLHLLRVVFTGAYGQSRRFNYLLGLGLFVIVVLLDFTGYILRWDEGVQYALVAGTNLIHSIPLLGPSLYTSLVGGTSLGSATLIRFYGWHIVGLMLIAGILLVWHLFRVRRDGGIAVPPPPQRGSQERISRFELLRREMLAMLVGGVILLILASLLPAPIAAPITAGSSVPEVARAPWFFLWVQELLKLGSPFLWGVLIPLAILILLALIPFILPPPRQEETGRWFPESSRLAQLVLAAVVLVILALTLLAVF